jgi:hypothetical protein
MRRIGPAAGAAPGASPQGAARGPGGAGRAGLRRGGQRRQDGGAPLPAIAAGVPSSVAPHGARTAGTP